MAGFHYGREILNNGGLWVSIKVQATAAWCAWMDFIAGRRSCTTFRHPTATFRELA